MTAIPLLTVVIFILAFSSATAGHLGGPTSPGSSPSHTKQQESNSSSSNNIGEGGASQSVAQSSQQPIVHSEIVAHLRGKE
jgi:hypothetical protein